MAREIAKKLDYLRDVIIILAIFSAGLGVEEVVASDELKNLVNIKSVNARLIASVLYKFSRKTYHASHAPNICASSPLGSQNNLW